jgi:hypothetical protein
MAESDSSQAVFKSSAAQLAKIMNLDETTPDVWNDRDLAAMLRHQMSAPLNFDLTSVEMKAAKAEARTETLASAAKERIKSFKDLLFHPEPPLELLRLSKDFFKGRTKACKKGSPEWQVAYLFYVLSILAAGSRAARLSNLTPSDLRKAIKWALDQKWVDAGTRRLVSQASQRLHAKTGA